MIDFAKFPLFILSLFTKFAITLNVNVDFLSSLITLFSARACFYRRVRNSEVIRDLKISFSLIIVFILVETIYNVRCTITSLANSSISKVSFSLKKFTDLLNISALDTSDWLDYYILQHEVLYNLLNHFFYPSSPYKNRRLFATIGAILVSRRRQPVK